jgi:hypothetical protein
MSEFKVYDRLPAESESQYLAFMCYRDQRTGRNLSRAYGRYLLDKRKITQEQYDTRKNPNPSRHFVRWRRDFFWDERCQEWDWEHNPQYSLWRTLGFFEKTREQTMKKIERLMVKSEASLARLRDFKAKQQAN